MTQKSLAAVYNRHKKLWLGLLILFFIGLFLLIANYLVIGSYAKYIKQPSELNNSGLVGVVLGGGIENGQPRPLLKDRLDTAAKLLQDRQVNKLLVSGDNRFENYNEPQVMRDYLVNNKGVDPALVYLDNAGRSTYETCERAKKIYSLDKAVFISETTHLPRVMYLCRSFGIDAYGIASDGQASSGLQIGQRVREFEARTKAFINVYIVGEKTVLGNKIVI